MLWYGMKHRGTVGEVSEVGIGRDIFCVTQFLTLENVRVYAPDRQMKGPELLPPMSITLPF